ncbi:MAG TPA: hypothetical protein VHE30_16040 [Polyangiaceae bacterium]|nr:hypothetical protein [Polyangiaceae bacterium]
MTSARLRTLVVVLLAFWGLGLARLAYAQLLSPGPLSKAHASLEGDQHCNDCHSSGKRVSQGGCLNCHADIGAKIAAGQGLHGLRYKGKPCESCHVEHLGGGGTIRWPGGAPSKLDHSQTGWPLEGAHAGTPCNKCHDKGNARGAHTYLGLSTACASCHKDPHDGRFGPTCKSCHDEQTWKNVKTDSFNHDLARFILRGAHQTTPCAKCHSEPPRWTGFDFAACTDCHRDVHRGKFGPTCTNCHNESRFKPAVMKPGAHPGTSLANGHSTVACRTCHDRGNLLPPSRGVACVSCHKPVHEAAFGNACATCHGTIQWLGLARAVSLAAHEKTAYPLTGQHESVDCARCHKPNLPESARYRELAFDRCVDCHEDAHRGEFSSRDKGECGHCHSTGGFRKTSFGVLAHASTRFPLEGTHTASPCSSCHKGSHPLLDLHVQGKACTDCHENPHGTQFSKEMAQGGCAHCHAPTGWHLPKIDHSTWPLTGAHATAECDACHHPTDEDRKSGRGASYRGIPRKCGGCHDDPHLGQFRLSEPSLECNRCHGTTEFRIPSFDHTALAGWALTGAHEKTACVKCHATTAVGERTTTRWRLPSAECRFCHADPHHQPEGHR